MATINDFEKKVCDILVALKAVSASEGHDLQTSFAESDHDNFVDFLIEENLVEKEIVLKALSQYYKVPPFDVDGYFFDHLLLRDFPKDFLLRNEIIPLEIDQEVLMIVASDPSNPELPPALAQYASEDVEFYVGIALDIQDAIKEFYDKSLTEPDDMTDPLEDIEEEEELNDMHELEELEEEEE